MCGIFGFTLKKQISTTGVLRLLEKLEAHQYPQEQKPVGGYGAGIAILDDKGNVILDKVGKISDSPAKSLSQIVKTDNKASVLVGHVRMPSPQFMETASFRETAQPYIAKCNRGVTVVSVHNGNVTNYKDIRAKLDGSHSFESEKVELIDSEVITHCFEEKMKEKADATQALEELFQTLEGPNAIGLLLIRERSMSLHFIHKGKTRGLTVWTNEDGEIIFCSRKELVMNEFSDLLARGKFKERVGIQWREEANFNLSFPVLL